MDAFERAKQRYYNHVPMPQAAEYVKQLEARVAELETEVEDLKEENAGLAQELAKYSD